MLVVGWCEHTIAKPDGMGRRLPPDASIGANAALPAVPLGSAYRLLPQRYDRCLLYEDRRSPSEEPSATNPT